MTNSTAPDEDPAWKESALASSRIGASLKAARERAGWSRETLAHHSGVSWSAIAQIESGRRKDVRLPTLAALAEALGVSTDCLVGSSAAVAPPPLSHSVLFYGSDEEFLDATVPFLREGLAASESVLVVTSRDHIRLLRRALADDGGDVHYEDSTKWLRSPVAALNAFHAFVKESFEAGAP